MAPPKRAKRAPLILQNREQHLPLATLARLLPDKPHPSAVRRWCRDGVKSEDGATVQMEFVWGTRRRCRRSSVEAYQRFIDLLNGYERS